MPAANQPHIALELLAHAFSKDEANRIFTEKVKQKPLLLRPTDLGAANAREVRRRERARKLAERKRSLKPKPLSAKEKRTLKIHDIPAEARRYALYEPLHRMWIGYIQEVLADGGMPVTPAVAARLASADFHGAELEVVRARCVGRVGLKGIVVKDTKFTFELVTPKNEVKVVPKEHSVFRFEVPPARSKVDLERQPEDGSPRNLVFELHGSQFENRATDRATKKFKPRNMTDL
ncbi:MAG: hypothetical protein M1826_007034 [Phylliscum demangeonii]|nr:MAG: hypothetical protein M1826_007034 [Phylliscum demangeonii]